MTINRSFFVCILSSIRSEMTFYRRAWQLGTKQFVKSQFKNLQFKNSQFSKKMFHPNEEQAQMMGWHGWDSTFMIIKGSSQKATMSTNMLHSYIIIIEWWNNIYVIWYPFRLNQTISRDFRRTVLYKQINCSINK